MSGLVDWIVDKCVGTEASSAFRDCKWNTTLGSAAEYALWATGGCLCYDCEFTNTDGLGRAVGTNSDAMLYNCTLRNWSRGYYNFGGNSTTLLNNLFEDCTVAAFLADSEYMHVMGNSMYVDPDGGMFSATGAAIWSSSGGRSSTMDLIASNVISGYQWAFDFEVATRNVWFLDNVFGNLQGRVERDNEPPAFLIDAGGNTELAADPFIDGVNGDYRLSSDAVKALSIRVLPGETQPVNRQPGMIHRIPTGPLRGPGTSGGANG